jgi:cation transport ATPase
MIDETEYSSKKSFRTLITLLILSIIALLVAIFVPSDFVSFVGIFLFLAALYLILYGGFRVYKAMKDPKIKEGKIGRELIIPIILVIIGSMIIVLVST